METYSVEKKIIHSIPFVAGIISLLIFLSNRNLWIDEAMLALNIIGKGSLELLKPLDWFQAAPILFLQIEKLFSILLPHSELGLRLFPLLCFWFSLFFFYQIVKNCFENVYTIIFALCLFSFNSILIHYSSEVKQYIVDVFVLSAIFYFLQRSYRNEKHKYYLLGIVGLLSFFLSSVAPIILLTVGVYLIYDYFFVGKKREIGPLVILFSVWLGVFGVYYYFFIHNHPAKEYMLFFWSSPQIFGFPPSNPASADFVYYLANRLHRIWPEIASSGRVIFIIPLFLIGLFTCIWQRKWQWMILTLLPLSVHFFLSFLRVYPFDVRLILYTFPCIMLVCSFGFDFLIKLIFSDFKIERMRLLAFIIPIACLYFLFNKYESGEYIHDVTEEIKKSIDYIEANRDESETVYTYYPELTDPEKRFGCYSPWKYFYGSVSPVFLYYRDIGYTNIVASELKADTVQEFANELRKLKGKHWLLFSHTQEKDDDEIIKLLDDSGCKKIKSFIVRGSSAYLYDFGENGYGFIK
jgi:hypothetical protein